MHTWRREYCTLLIKYSSALCSVLVPSSDVITFRFDAPLILSVNHSENDCHSTLHNACRRNEGRDRHLYRSCILFTEFNSPPNLVRIREFTLRRPGPFWQVQDRCNEGFSLYGDETTCPWGSLPVSRELLYRFRRWCTHSLIVYQEHQNTNKSRHSLAVVPVAIWQVHQCCNGAALWQVQSWVPSWVPSWVQTSWV